VKLLGLLLDAYKLPGYKLD